MSSLVSPAKVAFVLVSLGLLSAIVLAWAWVIYRFATHQRLLPQGVARDVPWGGKTVLAIVLTYVIMQTVLPFGYMSGLQAVLPMDDVRTLTFLSPNIKRSFLASQQIIVTILVSFPFLAISCAILSRWGHAKPADFGLDHRRISREVVRGVLAWPILAPIVFGMNYLATLIWTDPDKHPIQAWAADNPGFLSWLTIFFAAVVVAPLVEEFFFRGVLLGWLSRIAVGRDKQNLAELHDTQIEGIDTSDQGECVRPDSFAKPSALNVQVRLFLANLTVSLVFAAMHAQVWPSPIPLFLLALALGHLYQRTGSLIAPIALHMTFNGISTAILCLVSLGGGLDALKQEIKATPVIPPNAATMTSVSILHRSLARFSINLGQ